MNGTKRYMVQFRAKEDITWDDSLAFEAVDKAIEHMQAVVATNPETLYGRVYDQEEAQVVEKTEG